MLTEKMLKIFSQRGVLGYLRSYHHRTEGMDLSKVTSVLKKYAPTSLAGSWDNVGLLIEPSAPHMVTKMLLTNDLTTPVMEEAVHEKVDMILCYHPPIFAPLMRLTQGKWKERIVLQCVENRIALYSPHTSYDAVQGGVNDWLIEPFKGTTKPIETVSTTLPTLGKYRVEVSVPSEEAAHCLDHVRTLTDMASVTSQYQFEAVAGTKFVRLGLNANQPGLSALLAYFNQDEEIRSSIEISELTKPIIPYHGAGRICQLDKPVSLSAAVNLVKAHLKLPHVRLAKVVDTEPDPLVKSVAVCAGSGSSVLRGVPADLYLTGEMSHHDVLDVVHTGHSVILCDHSNTERGYLPVLNERLNKLLSGKVEMVVSQKDVDPLTIV